MTLVEFNEKWAFYKKHPTAYGLDIDDNEVIEYLDSEFEKEIRKNTSFQFSQIKLKFGRVVIYCNSTSKNRWVDSLSDILKNK